MIASFISNDGSGIWLPSAEIIQKPQPNNTFHELFLRLRVSDPSNISRLKPQFSTTVTSCLHIVEIRYHPLGTHNIILLVENVDSVDWRKTQRYVICNSSDILRYVSMKIPITEIAVVHLFDEKVILTSLTHFIIIKFYFPS